MYVGVDYYPEHWPKTRWPTDARLMRAAGFNVVRLAEFAWVNLEPAEGQFDFAWLDDALAILRRERIAAILGTPTTPSTRSTTPPPATPLPRPSAPVGPTPPTTPAAT